MRKAKPKKVALGGEPPSNIGARMRERRLTLNMRQDKVGKELGVSFQRVQKYEKSVNRVSASRLFEICRVLNVSLASMFERDPKV